jgi:hypothetical protein
MSLRPGLKAAALVVLAAACAPLAAVEAPPAAPDPRAAAAPDAPAAAPAPAAPSPPPVELVELQRLTRDGVAALLGDPDLYREEAGAQVLLYSQRACALHLFLYPPAPGATPVVEHLETIPAAPETDSDRACFAALLARQAN